jgi:hypothetical protein
MKIQYLLEGQKEQLQILSPNTIVTLYYPSTAKEVIDILLKNYTPSNLPVTSSLKHARRTGTVIAKFSTNAKYLDVDRTMKKSKETLEYAERMFPNSRNPLVTFSLLNTQKPFVMFKGTLSKNDIISIHVIDFDKEKNQVVDGSIAEFELIEFIRWTVNMIRRQKEGEL